jgi:hypothetical protein
MNLNDLNILKLILNTDEDEIYRAFPSRKGNVYAKSVTNIIPYKEYDFFNIPISVVKNNIRIPNDKYYGINFSNIDNEKEKQRLEFRYIGGKDYEKNIGQLIYFMERFIINVYDSVDASFNSEDINKLEQYLEDNIKSYKNLSKYDNFIVEFPSIMIQIDQVSNYDLISSYYDRIYPKLYNIIDSTDDIKDCIINYVTKDQNIEIVDANIKATSTLRTVDIINCKIEGIFEDCFFVGSEITNSQVTKCKLQHSDALNTKVLNCNVESSTLENCYFMDGYLNGDMRGGIYRSGKLGPYATLDSEVKIVKDYDNFFDTKFDVEDKSDTKGIIKGFGKGLLKK